MLAVLRKELKLYFATPAGWVFMIVFLLCSGIMFTIQNIFSLNSDFSSMLNTLIFIYLIVVPLLTMRIFTDEKRLKTDQMLLTSPTPLGEIVGGKFLAALLLFFLTLLITGTYPLILSFHTSSLEGTSIMGTYIGFFLLGGCFISIGLFISATTESMASSAILTIFALFINWILDYLKPMMPASIAAGFIFTVLIAAGIAFRLYSTSRNRLFSLLTGIVLLILSGIIFLTQNDLFYGLIGKVFDWLSLTKRFRPFSIGILPLDGIVYYLSFMAFFLFMTVQQIEKRRWS